MMQGDREVGVWLSPWAAASARVESRPGAECLTPDEIVAFLDGARRGKARTARSRAAEHLAECSFCSHEVAALYRARRNREERRRVHSALGESTGRLAACVRVLVEPIRGAFTRLDALLPTLGQPAQLTPTFAAAGGIARGEDDGEEDEPDQLHEVTVTAADASVEILLHEEDGEGAVTVSLPEPWEVRLVAPDGNAESVPLEAGADRYYAILTGIPPGEYHLAILRPSSPPGA